MKKTAILITGISLIMFLFSCGNTENKTNNTDEGITEQEIMTDETVVTEEVKQENSIEVEIGLTKDEIIALMGNDFTERSYEEEMTYAKVTELKYGEDAIVNIINSKVYSIFLITNKYSFKGVKVGDNAKGVLNILSKSFENKLDRFDNTAYFDVFTDDEINIYLQFDDGSASESDITDETKISNITISDNYDTTI